MCNCSLRYTSIWVCLCNYQCSRRIPTI